MAESGDVSFDKQDLEPDYLKPESEGSANEKREPSAVENLEFIIALDKKLHYGERYTGRANMSGGEFEYYTDLYTDQLLSPGEVERLLTIIAQSKDLVFYPINTNMRLSVGYAVTKIENNAPGIMEFKEILKFREDQLPLGCDWNALSAVFLSKDNLEKMTFYGFPPIKDRSDYEY